jgi:hypothetical protein
MTFTLTIELGNDAMRTHADLALALQCLADDFLAADDLAEPLGAGGGVRDLNGNTVGDWRIA